MEAKVGIATLVSDLEQDEINTNIIRQKKLNGLNGVTLYQEIELKSFYVLVRAPTENLKVPNVVIPIRQIDFCDFKLLYDIEAVNVMPPFGDSHFESYPRYIVRMKDEVIDDIMDLDIPVNKDSMKEISMTVIAMNFATKYFSDMIATVPLLTDMSGHIDRRILDFSRLKERNFYELFKKIKNENRRHEALQLLNGSYMEGDVSDVPLYARIVSEEPHYRDNPRNYTRVATPLYGAEANMVNIPNILFGGQYCHPIELLTNFECYQTQNFVIKESFRMEVARTSHTVRVPRLLVQMIDLSLAYKIPKVIKDFTVVVKSMVSCMVKVERLNNTVTNFKQLFRLSDNTASAWSNFTNNVTEAGIVAAIKVMHLTNINRNLFIVDGGTFAFSLVGDLFSMTSILIAQTLIPANCIPSIRRIHINNAVANHIYRSVMSPVQRQHFENHLRNQGYGAFIGNHNAWVITSVDLLAIMYMQAPQNTDVYVLIRRYMNGQEAAAMNTMIDGTPLSIWAPYMYGTNDGSYLADTRADTMREKSEMPIGGAIRIDTVDGSPSNVTVAYLEKINVIEQLYTADRISGRYSNGEKLRAFIDYLRGAGKCKYEAFIRYYTYFSVWYSTSICADSTIRNVNPLFKEYIEMNMADCLGIVLKIAPDITLNEVSRIYYLDGTSSFIGFTVFLTFYRLLRNTVARHGANFEKLDKALLIKLAGQLTAKVLGMESYNAENEFDVHLTDKAIFYDFLDQDVMSSMESPLVKRMDETMGIALHVMRNIRDKFIFVDNIYIAKKSLYYANNGDLPALSPVMATNAMPKHLIKVKKRYMNFIDLRNDMKTTIFPDDARKRMYTTVFENEFNKLKEPSMDGLRAGTEVVEVISVPVRSKISLEILKEDGYFKDKTPKLLRMQSVIDHVDKYANSVEGVQLFEVPIYLLLNNIGSQMDLEYMKITGNSYTDALSMGQVLIPSEQIPIDTFDPAGLIGAFHQEVIMKKIPFEIRPQMSVPFELLDSNNPLF